MNLELLVLGKVQQVIRDEQILGVFNNALANNWQVSAYRVNWQPAAGITLADHANVLLETKTYITSMEYDALNRVKVMRYPQDVNNTRKELRPEYNRAGALERVKSDNAAYVDRIAYNAKGQRVLIAYGNGILTRHSYDPRTFRLVQMRSERYSQPDALTYRPTGAALQDFAYEYDLVGNIMAIHDRTPRSGVANSLPLGEDALDRVFSYDPLYRLLLATGRECKDIPQPRPWEDEPCCGFNASNQGTPNQDNAPNLTSLYRERYEYDASGNILSLKHQQLSPGENWETTWSRNFGMGGLTPDQWQQEWIAHLNQAWQTYWLHNGMVTVNGEKMSKSLDNFTTIRSLLNGKWPEYPQPIDPMVIRLFVLQAHYRKPLDFTKDAMIAAENGWQTLKDSLTLDWKPLNLASQMPIPGELDAELVNRFQTALDDDFNTATGLAVLFELAKSLKREFNLRCYQRSHELTDIQLQQRSQTLIHLAQILGLEAQSESIPESEIDGDWIESLLQQRQQARQEKRYAESDRIRNELQAAGITVTDQPDGKTRWH